MVIAPKKSKRKKLDYDPSFQSKMVRTVVQDRDFCTTMAGALDPEIFDNKVHRWVAGEALTYAKKYGTGISKDALRNRWRNHVKRKLLKKDEAQLVRGFIETVDRPIKDRDYVRDEIHQFVKHQDTRQRIADLTVAWEEHDFEEVDRLFIEGQRIQSSGFGSLGHFWNRDSKQRMRRRKTWNPNGVPTGLPIDSYMKPGGLPPKTLGCVLAPPGRGKSGTLIHIGSSAIQYANVPVLYVSLELSEEVISDRFDAHLTKTGLNELEQHSSRVWKRTKGIGKKLGECLVVKEFPTKSVSVSQLEAYIRQLGSVGFYPGLIIVDYADLLKPSSGYEKRYEEVASIYEELRGLAGKLNVPIWTASQGNRGSFDKPIVTMADMASSIDKAAISDFILAVCQTKKELKNKKARLYVAKSRLGPQEFEIKGLKVDWSQMRIVITEETKREMEKRDRFHKHEREKIKRRKMKKKSPRAKSHEVARKAERERAIRKLTRQAA